MSLLHLTQERPGGILLIRSYREGTAQVGEKLWSESFIISPESIEPWAVADEAELDYEYVQPLLNRQLEIVILGTGHRYRPPTPQLMVSLSRQGIGIETMNSAAACRTYNILASEGRRVVAGLVL